MEMHDNGIKNTFFVIYLSAALFILSSLILFPPLSLCVLLFSQNAFPFFLQ